MTEGKGHTKGPWSFRQDSLTERDGCGYIVGADGNDLSHHGNVHRSKDENLANAAFIVRACNSHEAFVEALANLLSASERHIFSTECQKERDAARSALRAAQGETTS